MWYNFYLCIYFILYWVSSLKFIDFLYISLENYFKTCFTTWCKIWKEIYIYLNDLSYHLTEYFSITMKLNQSLSINRRIQMPPLNLLKMYVKLFFDFTNFEDFQNKICWVDSERFRLLLCEIIVLFACKHVTSVKSFEAPLSLSFVD